MIPPGVTGPVFASAKKALREGTRIRTRVDVKALAGTQPVVASIQRDEIADSQVNFTGDRAVNRTLQIDIDDPLHELGMDAAAIEAGFGGLGLLFAPHQLVWVDDFGVWVDFPMGEFRPTAVRRSGASLAVEAQDKSCLWLAPRSGGRLPKKMNIIAAANFMLRLVGERRFAFPPTSITRVTTGSKEIPWGGNDVDRSLWMVLTRLLSDRGLQLYYDELGRAAIRRDPGADSVAVAEWDASTLTSPPSRSIDLTVLRNAVVVIGKGTAKKPEPERLQLPRTHPISPFRLRVGDEPWFSRESESKPNLTGNVLKTYTAKRLARVSREPIDLSFEGAPVFHLTPRDFAGVTWEGLRYKARAVEASIPLGGSAPMTFGQTTHVRRPDLQPIRPTIR